jgi:sulfur carrier protein
MSISKNVGLKTGRPVKVIVNGEEKILREGVTIVRLLNELNIKPQGIAVELNLEIAPKGRYSEIVLKNGDRIEIVRMVGGG